NLVHGRTNIAVGDRRLFYSSDQIDQPEYLVRSVKRRPRTDLIVACHGSETALSKRFLADLFWDAGWKAILGDNFLDLGADGRCAVDVHRSPKLIQLRTQS